MVRRCGACDGAVSAGKQKRTAPFCGPWADLPGQTFHGSDNLLHLLERAMKPFFLPVNSRNRTEPAAVLSGRRPGPGLAFRLALGGRWQGCPTLRLLPHAFGQAVPGMPPQRLREQAREDGGGSIKRSRGAPHPPTIAQPQSGLATSGLLGQDGGGGAARSPSASSQAGATAMAPAGAGAAGSACLCLGVNAASCHSGWGSSFGQEIAQNRVPAHRFSRCLCQTLRLKCRLHRDKAGVVS